MRDALTHSERERANEIGSFCLAKTNVYARARVALDSIYTKLFALVFRFPFGSVFFSLKFHRRHIMCSKIWYRITDFYVHGLSVLFHSCYVFQLVIFPIFSIFFHSFFCYFTVELPMYQSSSLFCGRRFGWKFSNKLHQNDFFSLLSVFKKKK